MRVLHAIHDFLPRHRAGSELYALRLAREQQRRGDHVTVLCAEYDFSRRHGQVTWRLHEGVPVVELVNNWVFRSFSETYDSPYLNGRIAHVLHAVQPHVVHVHNLLNLSFGLPRLAKRAASSVVATLHDYTLVCPAGGQRVHLAEGHRCERIEPDRCARCFPESALGAQLEFGRWRLHGARGAAGRLAAAARRRAPELFEAVWRARPRPDITAADIRERLDALTEVYEQVDRFVAPSRSLADEMVRLGLPREKIEVADYGFEPLAPAPRQPSARLRIGFVGTVAWHKGLHVLCEAASRLSQDRIELLVYGDPDTFPEYGTRVRASAPASTRWMGSFKETSVADVFASIDVLVVPSLWPENSPLVIHEAFQAGVPVVGARVGGIPELVKHDGSGLLYDPESPEELAGCLASLLEDPARLRRLSAGAPVVRSIAGDADAWARIYDACSTSVSCS